MKPFHPESYDPLSQLWSKRNRKDLFSTPIFDLVSWHTESPDKRVSRDFFHLESKDWVNVIALTPENKILLIDQYRHGIHRYSLEIPGGIAEKNTVLESAQAELAEETGYVSEEWEYLGKVTGNPAILDNWSHTFVAKNVRKLREQDLDDSEQIEIFETPLENVPDLIDRNILHHGMMVAALGMYFIKHPIPR
ncbi:NUDIX hydrolase [Leptospira gomenensis]|uniref:GDP-mannose pyrophosphatase n=1 Tax=Leptospira gomenensis TaxID=2484974 RepID=A0A5F1Y8I2_9LEPT|nr:NUDIX hydrolase [Leptospira gomenensis]TGK31682.1 NUDIX hydrolase [Leptospira gomenensis]TGK41689.1 NUDIX hydrolase [Leptospira gomenensis]TGK43357.1 NUDIX hydrolase [Leptospira gomenensis]TGK61351.1 NUDIX hydrolase [Leptospira gomenensis]